MAKPEQARPLALVLPRTPHGDGSLAQALHDDLVELLQFTRLRVAEAADAGDAAKRAADHDGPLLLCFPDVPGLPPDCIEGALEMLQDRDAVIGPAFDGSVYLLGIAKELDPGAAAALIRKAAVPGGLEACTEVCEREELAASALPPWFRVGNEKELSFAERLARLSLLSEDGDMDFFADRLRLWFENR